MQFRNDAIDYFKKHLKQISEFVLFNDKPYNEVPYKEGENTYFKDDKGFYYKLTLHHVDEMTSKLQSRIKEKEKDAEPKQVNLSSSANSKPLAFSSDMSNLASGVNVGFDPTGALLTSTVVAAKTKAQMAAQSS